MYTTTNDIIHRFGHVHHNKESWKLYVMISIHIILSAVLSIMSQTSSRNAVKLMAYFRRHKCSEIDGLFVTSQMQWNWWLICDVTNAVKSMALFATPQMQWNRWLIFDVTNAVKSMAYLWRHKCSETDGFICDVTNAVKSIVVFSDVTNAVKSRAYLWRHTVMIVVLVFS